MGLSQSKGLKQTTHMEEQKTACESICIAYEKGDEKAAKWGQRIDYFRKRGKEKETAHEKHKPLPTNGEERPSVQWLCAERNALISPLR
jgi:hypothetical protein